MVGADFRGEPYFLNFKDKRTDQKKYDIGIETRAGKEWPSKKWAHAGQFVSQMKAAGLSVFEFSQRETVREYAADINRCRVIVCGDTLCMHLALFFKIPTIGFFFCTSSSEIFDYGYLRKIVSPLLERYFYTRKDVLELMQSIQVDEVAQEVNKILRINYHEKRI